MDHSMLVHVFYCLQYLLAIALDLELTQSFSSFDLLIESWIAAQLHDDVNVFVIFKEVLKLDNVWMVHWSMNFYLTLQLLLRSWLCKRTFRYNLDSLGVIKLQIADFVHFGKASFAQKGAFDISLDACLPFWIDVLLFNDLLLWLMRCGWWMTMLLIAIIDLISIPVWVLVIALSSVQITHTSAPSDLIVCTWTTTLRRHQKIVIASVTIDSITTVG